MPADTAHLALVDMARANAAYWLHGDSWTETAQNALRFWMRILNALTGIECATPVESERSPMATVQTATAKAGSWGFPH